jgi:hypothetical protein
MAHGDAPRIAIVLLIREATKVLDVIQTAITPIKAELAAFEQSAKKLTLIDPRLDPKIDAALASDAGIYHAVWLDGRRCGALAGP